MSRPDDEVVLSLLSAMESELAFGIRELPPGARVAAPAAGAPEAPEEPAPAAPTAAAVPAAPPTRPGRTLEAIAASIAECRVCGLCETRTNTVPGQGAADARLMFVGEAPGYNEDQEGLAFVGKAGQLLSKMITAMGLEREQVFIANVLKCRPPENRDPAPDEVEACFHYLLEQIDAVAPDVICTLGGHATNNLLERSDSMSRMRGRVFDFEGRKLVPTYHPSYLLRTPSAKRAAWEDLQVVMKLLGLPVS